MRFLITISLLGLNLIANSHTEGCTSSLFCQGTILETVQLQQVLHDGKEFVDRPTKFSVKEVEANFKKLGPNPNKQQLIKFVTQNFHPAGFELEEVTLTDFNNQPKFLKNITDPVLRDFGQHIHSLWSMLIRKNNLSKLCSGCESTIIDTKYPFVVPGGRFREFYYWDTFFSLEGLNVGELFQTSKHNILNFLDIVKQYGFMPNGARKYYLNRSQPPMLIKMVAKYIEATNDMELLDMALPILNKEYQYWITKHSINIKCPDKSSSSCQLTRYIVNNTTPRPESYREDYLTVEHSNLTSKSAKQHLYAELAAGAETGWDYSTRWIPDYDPSKNYTQEELLRHLQTSKIIPVDLNSIMYLNEITLSKFYTIKGNIKLAQQFKGAGERRAKLMEHYLWDAKQSSFYDYYIGTGKRIIRHASSNYWPLWADALTPQFRNNPMNFVRTFRNLDKVIKSYPNGQPSTEMHSGLQWDYPNKWAPLEYIIVEGLLTSHQTINPHYHTQYLYQFALSVAQTYTTDILCGWYRTGGSLPRQNIQKLPHLPPNATGSVFEKYSVDQVGRNGGGGEYEVQTGFGWTNGVLLHFLNRFPELKAPKDLKSTCQISS